MIIAFSDYKRKYLGPIHKDNEIISDGIIAAVDIDTDINDMLFYANFKVNDKKSMYKVEVVSVEEKKICIPFEPEVLINGLHYFEIVAVKDGNVRTSATYSYYVEKSLQTTENISHDSNFHILIGLIDDIKQVSLTVAEQVDRIDGVKGDLHKKMNCYTCVSNMKADEGLKAGDIVVTLGYYVNNDGGGAIYKISDNVDLDIDDSYVHGLSNSLKAELIIEDHVNVKSLGAKGDGVTDDTEFIQKGINGLSNTKVLMFPEGEYLCSRLIIGDSKNITFRGVSDNRGAFLNKSIGDTYSKIIAYNLEENEGLIEQTNSMIMLENLGFYNALDNTGELYRKNVLVEPKVSAEKGKFFLTNCQFYGWKTVFGCLEEVDYGGANDSKTDLLQSCVLATGCRFSHNRIALSQLVDSRIIDCSFNKNDYAIVMRKSAGITTISNCRIEWNTYNGIYVYQSHDLTIADNEFDRHGYAGLYVRKASNTKVTGNTFRRSGAYKDSTGAGLANDDYTHNVQMYISECKESAFSNNITKYQKEFDGTISGRTVPYNCSSFNGNTSCSITGNVLLGGYGKKNDPALINNFSDNKQCVVSDNILIEERSGACFNGVIPQNGTQFISVNVPFVDVNDSMIITVKIVEVKNCDTSQKDNFIPCLLNLMLIRVDGIPSISKGILLNAFDMSYVSTFKITGINYYPNSQKIGLQIKNTDSQDNRYIISI